MCLAKSQHRADGKQQLRLVEVLRAYNSSSQSKEDAGESISVLGISRTILNGLELTVYARLDSNSPQPCLRFPGSGITGMYLHTVAVGF